MINRNIDGARRLFTDTKPTMLERMADYLLAIVIGLGLCALVLHGLDALFI